MKQTAYLAINGATEEEFVISRVEVQGSHKVCVPAQATVSLSATHG